MARACAWARWVVKRHQRDAMHDDIFGMYQRWKKAGHDVTEMPAEVLLLAVTILMDHVHSRQSMLDGIDDMIAQLRDYAEGVTVDWAHIQALKARQRITVPRDPGFCEQPSLFR